MDLRVPFYSGKRDNFFLYVRESKRGLETKVSEDIIYLDSAYKKQVIAFLIDVIHKLEPKQKVNKNGRSK